MKLFELTIYGPPRTAKNSQSVINVGGRRIPMKSKALRTWEKLALDQIAAVGASVGCEKNIDYPVNVAIEVWVDANRRCDLVGYIQAVLDVLVKAKVLADDSSMNRRIAVSYDGSRVAGVDRTDPRVNIIITKLDNP